MELSLTQEHVAENSRVRLLLFSWYVSDYNDECIKILQQNIARKISSRKSHINMTFQVWIWHISFPSSNPNRYVHKKYGVNLTESYRRGVAITVRLQLPSKLPFKPGYHDVLIHHGNQVLKKVSYVLVWSYLHVHLKFKKTVTTKRCSSQT